MKNCFFQLSLFFKVKSVPSHNLGFYIIHLIQVTTVLSPARTLLRCFFCYDFGCQHFCKLAFSLCAKHSIFTVCHFFDKSFKRPGCLSETPALFNHDYILCGCMTRLAKLQPCPDVDCHIS